MFKELVDKGRELEKKDQLPSVGYYHYSQPIRWIVRLWPGRPDRIALENPDLEKSRPKSGRTGRNFEAHFVADEAGYVFGSKVKKKGKDDKKDKVDKNADKKHRAFLNLLDKALVSPVIDDSDFREALLLLREVLTSKIVEQDSRFEEILNKDWVTFKMEEGPLAEQHLMDHDQAKKFWEVEMQERTACFDSENNMVRGDCSICGETRSLLRKLPLQVKLANSTPPLHSLNAGSHVSFISGSSPDKKANIGLCFNCGDTAARAFNYLTNSRRHKQTLVSGDSGDSLENQIALFWLKDIPQVLPSRWTKGGLDLLDRFKAVLREEKKGDEDKPGATLSQLRELLNVAWKPKDSAFSLDEEAFYLAVLSPNVGRIALRDWEKVSLRDLQINLKSYLETLSFIDNRGEKRPVSINTLLNALRFLPNTNKQKSIGPNLTRGLLRTAFLNHLPPYPLLQQAVNRLRVPNVRSVPWVSHALCCTIKLVLTFTSKEMTEMEQMSPHQKAPSHLCGRLLALLERAQQYHHNFNLNKTIVDRFYGSASTAPATVFANLIRQFSTAHMKGAGKEINELIEEVMARLDESGGFPRTLSCEEQAQFALGFFHQKADFRTQTNIQKQKQEQGESK